MIFAMVIGLFQRKGTSLGRITCSPTSLWFCQSRMKIQAGEEDGANYTSSDRAQTANSACQQMPEAVEIKLLERVKTILHDPLTFVLLVWAVMFTVAGVCWILYLSPESSLRLTAKLPPFSFLPESLSRFRLSRGKVCRRTNAGF